MSSQPVNPLDQSVPIVTSKGTPTWEFMRKWADQRSTNDTIPDLTAVTGDITIDAADVATLASVLLEPGTYGDATHFPVVTVDAKGRTTHVSLEPASSAVGADPTATASDVAVNGSALTFMRSDAAPAVQKTSASVFGLAKVDGSTITALGGVITATGFAPSGTPFHPGFVAGRYYTKPFNSSGTTSFSLVASTLYAHPFYVPAVTTITKIAASINSGAAGKLLELGIYTDVGGQPAALELDAGSVSTTSTGAAIITVSHTLQPGWYWLVMASNGTPTMTCTQANDQPTAYLFGVSSASLTTPIGLITAPWTFSAGALPGTFPAITYSNAACPLVWIAP